MEAEPALSIRSCLKKQQELQLPFAPFFSIIFSDRSHASRCMYSGHCSQVSDFKVLKQFFLDLRA